MAIPLHTFEFDGSDYLRYPEEPWLNPRMIPNVWFENNVHKFLYSPEYIKREAVPYALDQGPWASGIYFLLNDQEIVYVGMSVEIKRRLSEHAEKDWNFTSYWCFGGIPKFYIEHVEAFYISSIQPPLNVNYPSILGTTLKLVELAEKGRLEYEHA